MLCQHWSEVFNERKELKSKMPDGREVPADGQLSGWVPGKSFQKCRAKNLHEPVV